VIVGGIGLTVGLTFTARIRSSVGSLSTSAVVCVLIGAGDFASDVVFARSAWMRIASCTQLGANCGASLLADFRLVATLATVCLAAPVALSIAPLASLLRSNRPPIDSQRFSHSVGLHATLLTLSPTNLELLQLLPWRERHFVGFPTKRILWFAVLTAFAEDVPQACLQLRLILLSLRHDVPGGFDDVALSAACVALAFSLLSIWWRGLRRLVMALCIRPVDYPPSLAPSAASVPDGRGSKRPPDVPALVPSMRASSRSLSSTPDPSGGACADQGQGSDDTSGDEAGGSQGTVAQPPEEDVWGAATPLPSSTRRGLSATPNRIRRASLTSGQVGTPPVSAALERARRSRAIRRFGGDGRGGGGMTLAASCASVQSGSDVPAPRALTWRRSSRRLSTALQPCSPTLPTRADSAEVLAPTAAETDAPSANSAKGAANPPVHTAAPKPAQARPLVVPAGVQRTASFGRVSVRSTPRRITRDPQRTEGGPLHVCFEASTNAPPVEQLSHRPRGVAEARRARARVAPGPVSNRVHSPQKLSPKPKPMHI